MNFLVAVISSAVLVFFGLGFVNLLQLDGYKIRYSKKTRLLHAKSALAAGLATAVLIAFYGCYYGGHSVWYLVAGIAMSLALLVTVGIFFFKAKKKKPLAFTPRVWRLLGVWFFLTLLLNILLNFAGGWILINGTRFTYIFMTLLYFFTPYLMYLSVLFVSPIETMIADSYIKKTREFFDGRPDLIKIGITGSYGKTSVKFMLEKMLSEVYNVVATPASYNTPMGISRSVELIEGDTEIFIAEMGARNTGDIKELCDIVKPSYAVITGVTGQHLETFKNIESIERTKYELIEALPGNGYAVFNVDNEYTKKMYNATRRSKASASLYDGDCIATHIRTSPYGSEFDLVIGGRTVSCATVLIGEHNILNIAMAAMMSYKLGVSLNQIAHAIGVLEPVPHRLEVMRLPTGITVIDDSYNSNEEGFMTALETLTLFSGRKVIATPGIVELGAAEREVNARIGMRIAEVCDTVFLIGERASAIEEGLKKRSFPEDSIIRCTELDEAQAMFSEVLKKGDIVLLENDLPDNY